MGLSKGGSLLTGLLWLAAIVIIYPSVKPAAQSFVDSMLAETSVTSGFDYFIISTIPFWGLIAGVLGALWIIYKGSQGSRGGIR